MPFIDFHIRPTPTSCDLKLSTLFMESYACFFRLFKKAQILTLLGLLVAGLMKWVEFSYYLPRAAKLESNPQRDPSEFIWGLAVLIVINLLYWIIFSVGFYRCNLMFRNVSQLPLSLGRTELRYFLRSLQATVIYFLVLLPYIIILCLIFYGTSLLPSAGQSSTSETMPVFIGLIVFGVFIFALFLIGLQLLMPASVMGEGYDLKKALNAAKGYHALFFFTALLVQIPLLILVFVGGYLISGSYGEAGSATYSLTFEALVTVLSLMLTTSTLSVIFARREALPLPIDE